MAAYRKLMLWISLTLQKLHITIEPFGFLFVTATIIQSVPKQYLLFFKVCGSQYGFNLTTSNCHGSNQTDSPTIKQNITETVDQVESYTSSLNMYGSLIDRILSAFYVLLIGPLSNQYGRKFLMVATVMGQIMSISILMAIYFADSLPTEFILFADVLVGVFGGRVTFVMAVNNYIVDVTSEETRTMRLAIMAGVVAMAVQISSQLISPVVYNQGGYLAIWFVALGFYALSLIYLFFFVPESREKSECGAILKSLGQWSVITFKQRKGYGRILIFSLIICLFLNLFSYAHYGVAYLYTKNTFSWDHSDFTLYTASFSLVEIIGALLLLPFLSDYVRSSDTVIGILSSSGDALSYLFIAIATTSTVVYLSALGHVLSLGITVVIWSMLSKLVEADEVSYVYAFLACLESIVPLIAFISFDSLYKATLNLFPAAVFLVELGIEIILTTAFVGVLIFKKKEKANSVRPATTYYLSPLKRLPR